MARTPPPDRPLLLIAGLGNPGEQYTRTRHNAGFWFCEQLADQLGVQFALESRFNALLGHHRASGVRLLMPQTFMNRSGQAIGAVARYYRIDAAQILIVHDELDLPPGQMRLKFGGGLGGHNGLKDSSAHLGTHDYWRLRLGIGHPGERNQVVQYVLKEPSRDQKIQIEMCMERALQSWPQLASGELEAASARLNQRAPAADA